MIGRRKFLASLPLFSAACAQRPVEYNSTPRVFDYTGKLYPRFPHIKRENTYFVIIHCTTGDEEDLEKSIKGLLSPGVNAHYLINRYGHIYKLVPDDIVAFTNGVSRWRNFEDLNLFSVNVELVGKPDEHFTQAQHDTFKYLYRCPDGLKQRYRIEDVNVLPHSSVAYCRDKDMHKKQGLSGEHLRPHRGRKIDPGFLFNRRVAGIYASPDYDPNVRSGEFLPYERQTRLVIYPEKRELAVEEEREVKRYIISVDKRGPSYIPKGHFKVADKVPFALSNASSKFIGISKNGRDADFFIHGTPNDIIYNTNLSVREFMHRFAFTRDYNDWTTNTVAMKNDEFDEIWMHVMRGTPVEVK